MNSHGITRRDLLTSGAVGVAALSLSAFAAPAPAGGRWKAAVIGHTSHGDYGHDLDTAFSGRADVEVVALADPDGSGRAKAAQRSGAARQYADYREMLEKERSQLVSVAPRWSDQHHAMTLAALRAGAHVLCEKPFTRSPAEADELLKLAHDSGLRVAVAHQMRLAPAVVALHHAVDQQGLIGDLVQIHAWGKQDATRAGGEDMMVLGIHLFDLMRLFAGEPKWCSARVLWQGRDITPQDARRATEAIGPVAGDEIEATFAFDGSVSATFTSRPRLRQSIGYWGMELVGSKAGARILADVHPRVYVRKPGLWDEQGRGGDRWQRWEADPGRTFSAEERGLGPANRRVVDDLLAAIREKREPACSGANAAKAIEMAMAVYRAGLGGTRVALPLAERGHPLSNP
jgi:predicted dehydrogenase